MVDDFEKAVSDGYSYWLGPVVTAHSIGEFSFVQYEEMDFNAHPKRKTGRHGFSVFINGHSISHSTNSLDEALVLAVAFKRDGYNTRAHRYFIKAVGNAIDPEVKRIFYEEEVTK